MLLNIENLFLILQVSYLFTLKQVLTLFEVLAWNFFIALCRSRKRCFENMEQIYSRTLMSKCDFCKVALNLGIGVLL